MSEITQAISRILDQQRIVIWHDPTQEFLEDYRQMELPGDTQKLKVDNNEFGIKHTVFTAPEEQKYLIYRAGEIPQETGNWLLDLELVYGTFTADRVSLALNSAGLQSALLTSLGPQHQLFFNDRDLLDQLKGRLTEQEDEATIKAKMTACILGLPEDQHSMQAIFSHLMALYAQEKTSPGDLLTSYNLEEFFWEGIRAIYHYPEDEAENFGALLVWLHRDEVVNSVSPEYRNIRTDYKAFRDSIHTRPLAQKLAQDIAEIKNYKEDHREDTLDELLSSALFEETEQFILLKLAEGLPSHLYTAQQIRDIVAQRQQDSVLWYSKYEESYQALLLGAQLLERISQLEIETTTLADAFKAYVNRWYTIDQLYRQYHLTQKQSSQRHGNSLFKALTQQINNIYTSRYLIPLNNRWSDLIDQTPNWREAFPSSNRQENFYTEHVQRGLEKARTYVIISDGLRYEVAQELERRLAQNTKYDTKISSMLGVLPSYTQLGMASLLPSAQLAINPEDATVSADREPTQGKDNRDKILRTQEGRAVRYKDIISLSQAEVQEKFKECKFVYIYHDVIDRIGDTKKSENDTFKAAEQAIQELESLIKKLHRSTTRILITADHGFIYQDEDDNDMSYLSENAHGDRLAYKDRRFVLGRGLSPSEAFHYFRSEELGLSSGLEILVPRSIQRLKKRGSGFKYVHGGASLQELTVPVINLRITKNKTGSQAVKVGFAEVPDRLTSNILTIKLVQQEPLENLSPLKIRAGLYHQGNLISVQPEATFNFTQQAASERQVKMTLELTRAADNLTEGVAELRLESFNTSTETWAYYAKTTVNIKRGNSTIDDFFN